MYRLAPGVLLTTETDVAHQRVTGSLLSKEHDMPDIAALSTPAAPSVADVVRRAVADPKFAAKLKHDAAAALKAGSNLQSPQMLTLQRHFYADPEAIAKLQVKDHGNDPALNKTWLTLTTFTSPECLTTTTTTTTIW